MTVDATSARTEFPFGNLRVSIASSSGPLYVAICCVAAFSLLRSPFFCLPFYYRTPSRHAVWNQRKLAFLRSICRPRYSPGFRSGRLAWSIDAAYLLRTIFCRRYSPRFRSNRSTTIDKGLPAPVYFRRSYSHEFRSGSRIHRRRRTCSRPHVPSMLLLMVLLRKARPRPSTQGCLLQSTRRRRYSPSEPAPDHLPSTLLS